MLEAYGFIISADLLRFITGSIIYNTDLFWRDKR
jgi:hypothetical protein